MVHQESRERPLSQPYRISTKRFMLLCRSQNLSICPLGIAALLIAALLIAVPVGLSRLPATLAQS